MKLSNRQIGAVGVSRVASALFRLGYSVLAPLEDFAGYDLVAEKNGRFVRIQVKASSSLELGRNRYGFVTHCGSGCRGRYSSSVDWMVFYAIDQDLFWIRKTKDMRLKTLKLEAKTGSSWRILSDL